MGRKVEPCPDDDGTVAGAERIHRWLMRYERRVWYALDRQGREMAERNPGLTIGEAVTDKAYLDSLGYCNHVKHLVWWWAVVVEGRALGNPFWLKALKVELYGQPKEGKQ